MTTEVPSGLPEDLDLSRLSPQPHDAEPHDGGLNNRLSWLRAGVLGANDGIVSVVIGAGALAADLLTRSTRLWVHTTSLGGVESTFERRRRWKSEPATIPDALVRLSVGIEDVEDLWADLEQALGALT